MAGRGTALVLALGMMLVGPLARAEATESKAISPSTNLQIPSDPAIRSGVLPNGLRYQVLSHGAPKGSVSIRLAVDAGSVDETEAERGFAHFVEHLAFRQTRNFPESHLDRVFAPLGVGFGRDQNAATSYRSTEFQLDLPDADAARLDAGFLWLRDVADGVMFESPAVDRERGVVLAEKVARNTPDRIVAAALDRFRGPGLRTPSRDPVGVETTVRSATPATLRAFYDRWYRPDNAVVVVVGDLPVAELEARVRSAFGSWSAKGSPPPRARAGRVDVKQGLSVATFAEPGAMTVFSACRVGALTQDAPHDLEAVRRSALSALWVSILNRRLSDLRLRDGALLNAGMSLSDDTGEAAIACLRMSPIGQAWDAGLASVQAELRRFERDGPTEAEMEFAVVSARADLVGWIEQAPTSASSDLADAMTTAALKGAPFPEPRQGLRLFDLAVDGLVPQDLKDAFARDWAGAGPFLAAASPLPPSPETLRAAWQRNEAAEGLEKYADRTVAHWAYAPRDAEIKPASREERRNPDYVRLTFPNGVVLNFKNIAYTKGVVEIRVLFGEGRREISKERLLAAAFGSGLIAYGGVGRHSYEEMVDFFGSKSLEFSLRVDDDVFGMSNTVVRSDLAGELQVLATYMADPGFRDTVDAKIPTAIDLFYRQWRADIAQVLNQAIDKAAAPDATSNLPPKEVFARLTSADFAQALKVPLTQSPIEITLAGDVEESEAVKAVGQTFAQMPFRPARTPVRGDTVYVRYPETAFPEIRVAHEGPTDKAGVMLAWPLYVAVPERRREEYALKVLAAVFSDELRHGVRERLGKTYAPKVLSQTPDLADQGKLMALVETSPLDLDAVKAEALAIAGRLARGEIDEEMLEAAKAPMLSGAKAFRQSNRWWAIALAGTRGDGQLTRDMMRDEDLTRQVTLEDVKAAAATWLSKPPLIAIAFPTPASGARP